MLCMCSETYKPGQNKENINIKTEICLTQKIKVDKTYHSCRMNEK